MNATAAHTVPELVAAYRARIVLDPDDYDGTIDLALWLVEDTAPRTWTPSELARALHVTTDEAAAALRTLVADGYVTGDDRGAWTRYTSRRR